jgi:hypothetical protein
MAFRTGTRVDPRLMEIDYSPSIRASEIMGATIGDVGSTIGKAITTKAEERKKEREKEELEEKDKRAALALISTVRNTDTKGIFSKKILAPQPIGEDRPMIPSAPTELIEEGISPQSIGLDRAGVASFGVGQLPKYEEVSLFANLEKAVESGMVGYKEVTGIINSITTQKRHEALIEAQIEAANIAARSREEVAKINSRNAGVENKFQVQMAQLELIDSVAKGIADKQRLDAKVAMYDSLEDLVNYQKHSASGGIVEIDFGEKDSEEKTVLTEIKTYEEYKRGYSLLMERLRNSVLHIEKIAPPGSDPLDGPAAALFTVTEKRTSSDVLGGELTKTINFPWLVQRGWMTPIEYDASDRIKRIPITSINDPAWYPLLLPYNAKNRASAKEFPNVPTLWIPPAEQ